MQTFERIKSLRLSQNLNQENFSKRINISRSNLGNIETGKVKPTERILSDICREFSINEDWLRYGEEPMYRPPMEIDNLLASKIGELIASDDEFVKSFVLEFLNLSPEAKESVKSFLRNISKSI